LFFCVFSFVAASSQDVGNIAFDPGTDDPKFELCNPAKVWQGYHLKTMMDETPINVNREVKAKFVPRAEWKGENGIIRVRFIVNCNGAADRFRLLELGFDLNEKQFSDDLRAHVISIAKEIQWPVRRARQQTVDYYHYFSIRITDGQLKDVIL
jgi:hypothetical protein